MEIFQWKYPLLQWILLARWKMYRFDLFIKHVIDAYMYMPTSTDLHLGIYKLNLYL